MLNFGEIRNEMKSHFYHNSKDTDFTFWVYCELRFTKYENNHNAFVTIFIHSGKQYKVNIFARYEMFIFFQRSYRKRIIL